MVTYVGRGMFQVDNLHATHFKIWESYEYLFPSYNDFNLAALVTSAVSRDLWAGARDNDSRTLSAYLPKNFMGLRDD